MKIARLQMAGVFGIATAMFLMTAVYAAQTKPAAPAAKAAAPAPAAKATPESIANGETLFKRQCQTCHGATGMGDGPAAKMLSGSCSQPGMRMKAMPRSTSLSVMVPRASRFVPTWTSYRSDRSTVAWNLKLQVLRSESD